VNEKQDAEAIPDEHFEYKLVGVVIHMGVAEAGHYLSYINVERGREADKDWAEMEKQKWLEFNDTRVESWNI
jgi:ubiquitin carboxyl-terminal hydrolase 9/24